MKLVKILAYSERQVINLLGNHDEASTAEFTHATEPHVKYINPDHILSVHERTGGFLCVAYASGDGRDYDFVKLTVDEAKALFES